MIVLGISNANDIMRRQIRRQHATVQGGNVSANNATYQWEVKWFAFSPTFVP